METVITLRLSAVDLLRLAEQYAPAREHLILEEVRLGDGWLEVDARAEAAGLHLNLTLRVTPQLPVTDSVLRMTVSLARPGWVPRVVQEQVFARLLQAFDLTGVSYRDGEVRVELGALQEEIGFSFALQGLTITSQLLTVELGQVRPVARPAREVAQEPDLSSAPLAQSSLPVVQGGTAEQLPPESGEEQQAFYQRLRERLLGWSESKLPPGLAAMLPWVLLLPDLFVLLVRLLGDGRVPLRQKALLGLAVAYIINPLDLIPDVLPVVGELDDLGIAVYVLNDLLQAAPPEVLREHWPGEGELLSVLSRTTAWLSQHAGRGLLKRLQGLLAGWRKPTA